MRYIPAVAACTFVFFAYGLFCLAMGWKNLGGAVPIIILMFVISKIWRSLSNDKDSITNGSQTVKH